DREDPGVVGELEMALPFRLGVRVRLQVLLQQVLGIALHGAELPDPDGTSAVPLPDLGEEGVAGADDEDGQGRYGDDGQGDEADGHQHHEVEQPLGDAVPAATEVAV